MGDLDYIYAVARIRVKEKSLLGDQDVLQMTGMKDEKEVLGYLADKGWGTGEGGESPDQMLEAEQKKTDELMRELKVDPAVFEVLAYPQLYHNLKAAIRETCTSDSPKHLYYDLEKYNGPEMKRILKEKDYAALPEQMRDVAERAFQVMLTTGDGQKCDVLVDRACLDACEAAGRKSKSRLLADYEESTVAVTDIKIAVRARKTGKDLAFLREALAPCKKLDVELLAQAAAKGEEALHDYLTGHGFGDAAEALKESPSAFERWCDNQVIEAILPQKTNSVSAGPIVAYYLARQNEMKTVRIILTAKANGFSEEDTRERVRKMYG